jgi:hypothetical protein
MLLLSLIIDERIQNITKGSVTKCLGATQQSQLTAKVKIAEKQKVISQVLLVLTAGHV